MRNAAVLVVLGACLLGSGRAATSHVSAEGCTDFAATAAAAAVRVMAASPQAEVVGTADAEGPAAQAHVDGLGNSSAWTGAPYPGDVLLSGLASTAAAAGLQGARYPLMAASQYPTSPGGSVEYPGLVLATARPVRATPGRRAAGPPMTARRRSAAPRRRPGWSAPPTAPSVPCPPTRSTA